ncbi:Peptidase family M23 [Cryobacterium psychrotolerans]|uniref:Peptidase family M23 n=1 Tax=Cryobacterium psychrotolerans TaxID=386301 RepID=A0A1G9DYP5_9MICO|nr:M23 family metallopeptidase [Cryobacterium psychrotolerans]TFD83457.1 M23 family metallopeptidase [Cryobacterium psychrotolerans]SDK68963.1 Peptidase family M23 [Cryobacterium psychrotolerans]
MIANSHGAGGSGGQRGSWRGAWGVVVILSLVAAAGVIQPARATEYPSWADVENARASEASKRTQIDKLTTLIAGLKTDFETAKGIATRRGAEYERAQGLFDEATYRATILQAQADEAAKRADASRKQAGRLASMLSRSGGTDLSMTLFLNGSDSEGLFSRLGSLSKLTERTSLVYAQAASDRNSATALTNQAKVAKKALGALAAEAQSALTRAVEASSAVQRMLAEQQQYAGTMQAQLAVLKEGRAATEADFAKGETVRRAAAAAAAAAAATGGGGSRDSGQLSGQGWALPVSGWISSRFGPRPSRPVAGVGAFHYGTDIAAGCGRGVFAATAGTVVYAGDLGSYGNWVLIDHGNGVQTGYAHNSRVLVKPGQSVDAGAAIALVGTTGASSGCHVHFETRVDGARIDPERFMSARGIRLG